MHYNIVMKTSKKNSMSAFLRGFRSLFDVFPSERDVKFDIPKISVEESLKRDWEKVGNDIKRSAYLLKKAS